MKIRSTLELNGALSSTLAWRKKEITTIFFTIQRQKRAHIKQTLLRSFVPILYAHWEGYAKEALGYYIEFVSRQRLPYCELTTNFITISCWKTAKEVSKSNRFRLQNQLIDFVTYNQNERAKIPYHNVLNTESNLSSVVLKNMLSIAGLPYDEFWRKKTLAIDGKLLHYRNKIAHGERYDIDEKSFFELHQLLITSLDYIKSTIENFAAEGKYKRKANAH